MKKPSDQFRVDETNELLAQIPGMGFAMEGRQRTTGGDDRKLDSRMKVESTNKVVEAITGKQIGGSKVNKPGHAKLYEADQTKAAFDKILDGLDDVRKLVANEGQQCSMDARDHTLDPKEVGQAKVALNLLNEAAALLKNASIKVEHASAARRALGR